MLEILNKWEILEIQSWKRPSGSSSPPSTTHIIDSTGFRNSLLEWHKEDSSNTFFVAARQRKISLGALSLGFFTTQWQFKINDLKFPMANRIPRFFPKSVDRAHWSPTPKEFRPCNSRLRKLFGAMWILDNPLLPACATCSRCHKIQSKASNSVGADD